MVVAIHRRANRPQQAPMQAPKKPRNMFGNGQSIWGGMPEYLTGIQNQPMPEMGQTAPPDDFGAMIAELNAQAAQMPQQAQMQQPQKPSPVAGLMAQKFEKPKPTWSDALGIVSGALMDYDGTLGSGNMQRAQGMMQQRVDESRAEFEQRRQEQIMMAAAQGDETALAMLDPLANRAFQYGQQRDAKADQITERAWLQDQQRYETEQERFARLDARGIYESDRSYNAAQAERQPRDIWQSAGDGAIFNQSTGAYKQVSGGGNQGGQGGGGYTGTPAQDNFYIPTSADADNPFIQLQFGGMPTQGAEGGTLFDNGEIYTPGANGAQEGGGMPPNVDPNMYQRYRSSEYAKTDAKVAKDAREAAIKISTKTMPQIAQLKSLAGQFPSGFASDARYEAGRVAPFLRGNVGMSEAEMAARDTFVSQTKAFVLDLAQQMKGSLSDSDRAWVETMGARTNMTPESINQVLDTAERMAERQEFYAQGAEVWSNQYGGLSMTDQNGKNFYQAWSDWSSMNPITGGTYGGDAPTSGQSRRGGDDRKGGGTPKYERTATNPQTGEKIGLVNGQWVPIQ